MTYSFYAGMKIPGKFTHSAAKKASSSDKYTAGVDAIALTWVHIAPTAI